MWSKHLLVSVLSLSLVLPRTAAAAPTPTAPQLDQQIAAIERLVNLARDLRTHIDRSAFDPEALLDRLDYDAEQIIEFVNESIAFEQYPGTLRGPAGTLMARAGNSLDQALLLAKLLRDAGYDARIAQSRLTRSAAQGLLLEMARPKPAPAPVGDASAILATLKAYSDEPIEPAAEQAFIRFLQEDPALTGTDYYQQSQDTARFLKAKLAQAKIQLDGAGNPDALIEEARDYFWVQFRDTVAAGWQDVHPARAEDPAAESLVPEQFHAESIPESLQHRLQFQMFVEVRRGERLDVVPISHPWERPVANLLSEPLVFGNLPDTVLNGGMNGLDLQQAFASASYLAPVFRGGVPPGGRFFDLNGNIIDPMGAGNPAAGVFKNVGDAFHNALGGMSGDKAQPTLTAQWVEYTLIRPGGESRTYRRTTFDRIGPAARARGAIPEDLSPTTAADAQTLLQRHTFMLSAGATPRAMAIDFSLQRIIETYPAIVGLLRMAAGGQPPDPRELERIAEARQEWAGHPQLFNILDGANRLDSGVTSYRSGPALVAHRQGLGADGQAVAAIDIVANPRRSLSVRDGTLSMEPFSNVLGGIWETALEGVRLEDGDRTVSTASAIDDAIAADVPIRLIEPGGDVSGLELADDARFHLQADLAAGYAVVVPESAPGDAMTGWWRVNVNDGETLGQLSDGRGSAAVEYLKALSLGFSLGMLACGLISCERNFGGGGAADNARLGCCVIGNFALFGLGYLAGALAAARTAHVAALLGGDTAYLWQQTLIVSAGSAAYDTVGMLAPLCQ